MKNILTIILITTLGTNYAQISTFYVAPNQTDSNYSAIQDSHLVIRNTTTNVNRLLLFMGGTGSNPKFYRTITNFAGRLGYDVINLSYINTVAAASLANSPDSLVFDKFRQEICYGTPVSPDVNVDTLNSIYARTVKLLNYMHLTYPKQNWIQYLDSSGLLDWSKIIVAGHSQGSGHACYFGKQNLVSRVLMFSGPNDYSDHFSNAAKWIRTPGKTKVDRQFSYLSLLDEIISFQKQFTILKGLNLFPTYDTIPVDNLDDPYDNSHCLYTTQNPGLTLLYHNTPVKFSLTNNIVWTYMLDSIITTRVEAIDRGNPIEIFPNPTNSSVNIKSNDNLLGKTVRVFSPNGQILKVYQITTSNSTSIDISSFPNGLYYIQVRNEILKVLKS